MSGSYTRGDIYYANLQKGIGSEQEGYRPVVIIQNNIGNRHSPTVIIAAMTSKVGVKAKLPTHYFIDAECGLELPTLILTEQLRTIDKRRLDKYIGHLSKKHIAGMDRALAISIDLIHRELQPFSMTLCRTCADNFRSAGVYYLRRSDPRQTVKETCTYCNHRMGFDYEVVSIPSFGV